MITMSTCQVHVHCPEDKFLPNQNANERISDSSKSNKGKWTFTPRRGTVLIKKKAMIGQKKRHGAQEKGLTLQEKGMAQCHPKRA